jgi:uncharacterized membrane protein required for colicin V production
MIAFAVIFSLCMIAVRLIAGMTNGIFRLPILGTANRLLGAGIGVVKAFLILFLISTVVAIIVPVMSLQKNPAVSESTISQTTLFKSVYNINPLTHILLKQ